MYRSPCHCSSGQCGNKGEGSLLRPIAHLFCPRHGHRGNQGTLWAFSLLLTPKSRVKIPNFLFSSLLLAEGTPRLENGTTCHCLQSTTVPFFWLQKHHKHLIDWKGLFGCKRWQLVAGRRINVSKFPGKREEKREIQ